MKFRITPYVKGCKLAALAERAAKIRDKIVMDESFVYCNSFIFLPLRIFRAINHPTYCNDLCSASCRAMIFEEGLMCFFFLPTMLFFPQPCFTSKRYLYK